MRGIYTKTFTRDFSLAIVEIWSRAEVLNPKLWTNKKQPHQPYIVCERDNGAVDFYYDLKGIEWVEKNLIEKARADKTFIKTIEKNISNQMLYLQPIFERGLAIPYEELIVFLNKLEENWTWFEAAWWLWKSISEKRIDFDLLESFKKQRENTQNLAPGSDKVIINSLKKIYPEVGDLVSVLTVKEIVSKKIPDREELRRRFERYIFTDNKLFINISKKDIENKYGIEFEEIKLDKNINQLAGQIAYKGVVRGIAKCVKSLSEIDKVKKGDIIVSPMTLPTFMLAMKKTVAFVTNEGSIMCHAAIIAREMKKPCIVGTKYATEIIKDGDLIEVDANKGIVRIIERKL